MWCLVAATDRPNQLLLGSPGFDRLSNIANNMRKNCEQSFSSVLIVGKESDELTIRGAGFDLSDLPLILMWDSSR